MPPVLHLKPEEVDTPEKRATYTVAVVGCSRNGLLFCLAFAEVGFKVICSDANQSVVKQVSKGKLQLDNHQAEAKFKVFERKELITVTGDLKTAVSQSELILIAITPRIDRKNHSDFSELEGICKQVGAAMHKGSLVVYGGLAGLGFVDGTIKETLENTSGLKAGEDFGFAYSPLSNLNGCFSNQGCEVIVAAGDKFSLASASMILEIVTKAHVTRVQSSRIAELVTLFAAAKRDLNTALTNEFSMLCEEAGIDYNDVKTLAHNQPCESSLGPTIFAEINKEEAYLLLESAENLNVKLRLPILARQVNEEMAKHAISLTIDALRNSGGTLRRAKIAVFGETEPGTSAAKFVELLKTKGAKVNCYNPQSPSLERSEDEAPLKKTLNETAEGTNCVVVLSAQEQLKRLNLKKLHAIMKSPQAIVDLAGVIDPLKAENEGFVYRGLGRVLPKK